MSQAIAIVGPSGSGKSTSIRTLDPKETYIINVANKALPFQGWKGKYNKENKNITTAIKGEDVLNIVKLISEKASHIKYIVIDDAQYVLADEFMRKANEKGYDKFTSMAKHLYDLISPSTHASLREDLYVFFLFHDDKGEDNTRRIKSIGKLLNEKITIEGLFTIVLFTDVEHDAKSGNKYYFVTQTDGNTTAKSPAGMFSERLIPNDLQFVVNSITKYENG
jgi:adenylate kinase family enzyme